MSIGRRLQLLSSIRTSIPRNAPHFQTTPHRSNQPHSSLPCVESCEICLGVIAGDTWLQFIAFMRQASPGWIVRQAPEDVLTAQASREAIFDYGARLTKMSPFISLQGWNASRYLPQINIIGFLLNIQDGPNPQSFALPHEHTLQVFQQDA